MTFPPRWNAIDKRLVNRAFPRVELNRSPRDDRHIPDEVPWDLEFPCQPAAPPNDLLQKSSLWSDCRKSFASNNRPVVASRIATGSSIRCTSVIFGTLRTPDASATC